MDWRGFLSRIFVAYILIAVYVRHFRVRVEDLCQVSSPCLHETSIPLVEWDLYIKGRGTPEVIVSRSRADSDCYRLDSVLPGASLSNASALDLKAGVDLDYDLKSSCQVTMMRAGIDSPYELRVNRVAVRVPSLREEATLALFLSLWVAPGLALLRGNKAGGSGQTWRRPRAAKRNGLHHFFFTPGIAEVAKAPGGRRGGVIGLGFTGGALVKRTSTSVACVSPKRPFRHDLDCCCLGGRGGYCPQAQAASPNKPAAVLRMKPRTTSSEWSASCSRNSPGSATPSG